VSLSLVLGCGSLAWNYYLGWSGFEICFVKIDCEQLSDLWFQNSWSQSVWGTKDSWKGPYDIKAMVVISLSHLI
jgi:hypothetical protein